MGRRSDGERERARRDIDQAIVRAGGAAWERDEFTQGVLWAIRETERRARRRRLWIGGAVGGTALAASIALSFTLNFGASDAPIPASRLDASPRAIAGPNAAREDLRALSTILGGAAAGVAFVHEAKSDPRAALARIEALSSAADRARALRLAAACMGVSALPLLEAGVESSDERVAASALEAVATVCSDPAECLETLARLRASPNEAARRAVIERFGP